MEVSEAGKKLGSVRASEAVFFFFTSSYFLPCIVLHMPELKWGALQRLVLSLDHKIL